MDQKTRFDRRVLESKEEEIIFKNGQLIQVYQNDLAKSIGTECKLTPMWLEPHRVTEHILNSYKLETLDRQLLDREYHARQLREFIPREGTELAAQQKKLEERRIEVNLEREHEDVENIEESGDNIEPEAVDDQQGRLQNGGGWMEQGDLW